MKIKLQHVHYIPKELKPGILYVSEEFYTAAHLCPCGCGSKVRTPLGPTEWILHVTKNGPSLEPSIGNWQFNCQSHYWINEGRIIWSSKWSPEQIAMGLQDEEKRRHLYYDALKRNNTILGRFWHRVKIFLRG